MASRRGKRSAATALSPTPSPPPPSALSTSVVAAETSSSAASAFPLTPKGISLLKTRRHTGQPPVTATVRVLSVHRFLIDAQYVAITNIAAPVAPDPDPPSHSHSSQLSQPGLPTTASSYFHSSLPPPAPTSSFPFPPSDSGYDVVLGDGDYKTKCLLAPNHSSLVEQGGLLPGSIVTVYDCVRRYDETVVGGQGFVVIRGMTVRDRGRTATLDGGGAAVDATEQWASAEGSKEREYQPLLSSRSFYLNLWHDDSLDLPTPPPLPPPTTSAFDLDDPSLHLITIVGALAGDYNGNQTLLCRVSGKSRLIRFGRSYTANGSAVGSSGGNSAPFMFEMLLIDATGCLKAAVWNSLAAHMYRHLHVGQVLAISHFRHRHHADTDEVELSLNSSYPAATIHVVPPSTYATLSPPVPVVPYSMVRLWEVRSLPDKKHADVMCEVGWVGRMEREWSRQYRQYFSYRWLLLQDGTAAQSLAVKLYCNSQDEQVASVSRGEVVLVTSLQLTTTREMVDSRQRSVYAQTTQFSQLTREAQLHSSDDTRLTDQLHQLQQWRTSRAAITSPLRSMWQWDVTYVSWESKHWTDGRVVVTPVSELRQLRAELRWMQHRTVLVQGVITDVQLMPAGLKVAGEGEAGQGEKVEAAVEQPAEKRGGRPRKRPPVKGLPSPSPLLPATSSVIPTVNATLPLLQFQLSDLNYEHHVCVQLTDRPVPYASVGSEGSALHVYRAIAEDAEAAIARLPAVVRGLLELLPATAIDGEVVERVVSAFNPPTAAAQQQPPQRKTGRSRGRSGTAQPPPPPPHTRAYLSQPVQPTAPLTRSRYNQARSHSQETEHNLADTRTTRQHQQSSGMGEEAVDGQLVEQEGKATEMSGDERQKLVSGVVSGLLLNRQALTALSVYRTSYEIVEVSVTNLFSIVAALE